MRITSRWQTALFMAGLFTSMVGFGHTANAIPHDGETRICGNCGGVSFSWFHRAKSNPTTSGEFSQQIQDGTPISYEWLPSGSVGATSKQIFNRGSSRILDSAVDGIDFTVDLWTDHAGNLTGTDAGDLNVLAVRAGDPLGSGGTHLGFNLTHKVSGRFGFTIMTANAVVFDEFVFDPTFDMGPVDKIGNAANGNGDVGTFLWGYTSGHDSQNFFGSGSSTRCLFESPNSGGCSDIVSALYGVNGVGIDLAYTGSFIGVSEPGALGVLALGLAGLALMRRRPGK